MVIKMAKALLVDDEKYIRSGLRAIISRTSTFFCEIDECANGTQALEKLNECKYDLLITDLVMPIMGGIELMERLQNMEHMPYTIILSGHDEFKYAQKAIEYGAKAFLLKPIDRNELVERLDVAQTEINRKKFTRDDEPEQVRHERGTDQLKLILLSDQPSEKELQALDADGLETDGHTYFVAVINSLKTYRYEAKRENNAALVMRMEQYIAQTGHTGYCFLDNQNNAVAVMDVCISIEDMLRQFDNAYGCGCTAGVGPDFATLLQMRDAYAQAEYALRYGFLKPDEAIMRSGSVSQANDKYVLPVRKINNLVGMLDTGRKDELIKTVSGIFNESEIEKYGLVYLERLTALVKERIVQYLSEHIPHEIEYIREQEQGYQSYDTFCCLCEYVHYITKFVLNINDVLLKFGSICHVDKTIEMAVKYIQENYQRDLTMAEVANHTCLNYSYFSILFKEKTGMNFGNYLRMFRIERAKCLLKSPINKVYEVAQMVGYNNAKHFATTFRTLTGISPKEYRESLH
ncbi:MAG: response regulator [Acetanaerobacterium sp.]